MNDQKKCAFCSMAESVSDWFSHPFNPQGSALNWLLFLGLLIIAAWMWNTVLFAIREEV